ncbi:MAG: FlgD immunoglobulin-like domain containing protein [Gemmatimonadota bacterium]
MIYGLVAVLALVLCNGADAAVRTWRVGDAANPWRVKPVSGIVQWGRGWSTEVLMDEDGDGLIDEDPVELIDNDGDGLLNEDPVDPQRDNDGDGQLNEDPIDGLDNDGDGLVDEDGVERFDNDRDGLFDEDGPDPQIDNDGDGLVNEDGLWTFTDDDYDGRLNEDPPEPGGSESQVDNDGDGLVNEDPYGQMTGTRRTDPLRYDPVGDDDCWRLDTNIFDVGNCDGPDEDVFNGRDDDGDGRVDEDDYASELRGISTWLAPVRLDSTREYTALLAGRQAHVEYGDGFITVPTEGPIQKQSANAFSTAEPGSGTSTSQWPTYVRAYDRSLFTAYGTQTDDRESGIGYLMWGYYYVTRLNLRPRPSLPDATPRDYWVKYGDDTDVLLESQRTRLVLVPVRRGESNIIVKDFRFDPPVVVGAWYYRSLHPTGTYWEIAEIGLWGDGYAKDGFYSSELIDVGTSPVRVRRYQQQWDRYNKSERAAVLAQFPEDAPGKQVTWGRVRWQGRKTGNGRGNVRIQFRAGDTPDTHVWQRSLGAGLGDSRNVDGTIIDAFTWAKLDADFLDRQPEELLPYNELGAASVGSDGPKGWSFWTAPFKFEDGLVDTTRPLEGQGVLLPLPGQTRYLQFRVYFDSDQHGAVALDWLEFEYDDPVVSDGLLAEVYPARVPLGQPQEFRYFIQPRFRTATGETGFNRIEVMVPDSSTALTALKVDDVVWEAIPTPAGAGADPLAAAEPKFVNGTVGQYAYAVLRDPRTGLNKLQVKVPRLTPQTVGGFGPGQGAAIELNFTTALFSGSARFTSSVWNDGSGASFIPQPAVAGDASPELSTDNIGVVAEAIAQLVSAPQVTPNPFSPNGDLVNDEVAFSFGLYLVTQPVQVKVDIFDLSGRPVRALGPEERAAGQVRLVWNGQDNNGNLVPPGVYLYRLAVEDDENSKEHIGTVAVAY